MCLDKYPHYLDLNDPVFTDVRKLLYGGSKKFEEEQERSDAVLIITQNYYKDLED